MLQNLTNSSPITCDKKICGAASGSQIPNQPNLLNTIRPIDCVIPLCGVDENGAPELVGSGVLLEVGTKIFLITATHIFTDNKDTTFYYQGKDGLEELTGTRLGADRNKEDVSVMLLDGNTVKEISCSYSALPIFSVEMNDVTNEGDLYTLSGFPQDLQDVDKQAAILRTQRFTYSSPASCDRIYRKCNVRKISHIVVNHAKKRAKDSEGNIVKPPSQNCMSGGAVWKYLGSDKSALQLPAMRLVGITIERHARWEAAVATRVNFAIEAIRSEFPELSELIPLSCALGIEVIQKTK